MSRDISKYSKDELKEAIVITILELKKKYEYVHINDNEFESIIDKLISQTSHIYTIRTSGSFEEIFKERFNIEINKILREKVLQSVEIIEDFINQTMTSIEGKESIYIEELKDVYKKCNYIPNYNEAKKIITEMPQLKLLFANTYSNMVDNDDSIKIFNNYSKTIQTFIEAFCDIYNLDLVFALTKNSFYENVDIEGKLINDIKDIFNYDNSEEIKKLIQEIKSNSDNKNTGEFINRLIELIEKNNNKSYDFEKFANEYEDTIYNGEAYQSLSQVVLRGGIYKYLKPVAQDNEIDKLLDSLPELYKKILTIVYGDKSYRYYTYNNNLGEVTLKKASIILRCMKDYLKYKKGEYVLRDTNCKKKKTQKKNEKNVLKQKEALKPIVKNQEINQSKEGIKELEKHPSVIYEPVTIQKLFSNYTRKDAVIIILKFGLLKDNRTYTNEDISNFLKISISHIVDIVDKFKENYKVDNGEIKKLIKK